MFYYTQSKSITQSGEGKIECNWCRRIFCKSGNNSAIYVLRVAPTAVDTNRRKLKQLWQFPFDSWKNGKVQNFARDLLDSWIHFQYSFPPPPPQLKFTRGSKNRSIFHDFFLLVLSSPLSRSNLLVEQPLLRSLPRNSFSFKLKVWR